MKDDLISRSALLKSLCNSCDGWCDNTECDCLNCKSDHRCDMVVDIADFNRDVENVRSALDAEPVRHGEWIDRYGGKYANHLWECSECKGKALWRFEVDALGKEIVVQDLSDYCPNCGAKMDGGGDK